MSSAPLCRDAAACSRRTRRRASVALSAGILAIACHAEQLTGPSAMLPVPRADAGGILGPASIPIPENNTAGGALPAMSAGLSVPIATSFIVRVSGQTTVSNNPAVQQCDPTQPVFGGASVGPNGDAYYQLKVSASLRQPSGSEITVGFWVRNGGSALESDTLWASTALDVRVARSGIQGSMNGQNCSSGLYNLSSAQTISVEVLDGHELQLEPSAVVVRTGTPVSFTATSRGAAVTVPSWAFVPASATPPNETSTCGADGANPCVVTVKNTGELRVSRYLYGRWRSASAALRVYTTFTLAADRSAVPPGRTVTFTPTLDGVDGVASRWVWRDSSGAQVVDPCASIGSGKCGYAPATSGTMWAYTNSNDSASAPVTVRPATLALTASKTSVLAPGENVTFTPVGNGTVVVQGWSFTPDGGGTPAVSPGSTWGQCTATAGTCQNLVSQSGTISVVATVDGVQQTASVHVRVVPCPTTEPVLNDSTVRAELVKLISKSGPDLSPGDPNKREYVGDVYRRQDGSFYFVEDALAVGNECTIQRSSMVTRRAATDSLVGMGHSHPTRAGLPVYGCPPDENGKLRQRYPGDNRLMAIKAPDSTFGGGSIADWIALAQANPGSSESVNSYVVSADGEVWMLPAFLIYTPSQQASNRRMWRYSGNANPSCNW